MNVLITNALYVYVFIYVYLSVYTHTNDLHSLYSSPNIVSVIKSRRMRRAEHVARMGEGRCVYRVLVGRPEGKRLLERPRCRWEDNIKMGLRDRWVELDSAGSG
jgi:hypothetical protein